ncbi:peptidase S26 domain-containing protein [Citrus sinensis]|nr:peptidase S26 domain-containing protein [Citrus sinensis]
MPCESWGFLRWPGLDGSLKILIGLLLWSTFSEIRFIPSSSMYPTLRIGDRIIVEKASYYFRNPSIHDIVTFRAPFQVRDGSLYVNGIAQNEDFIAEHPKYTSDLTYVPVGYVYVLGDNRNNSFDSHVWLSGWDGAANSWFLTRFSVTIHVLLVCSLFYMFTCCRVENANRRVNSKRRCCNCKGSLVNSQRHTPILSTFPFPFNDSATNRIQQVDMVMNQCE